MERRRRRKPRGPSLDVLTRKRRPNGIGVSMSRMVIAVSLAGVLAAAGALAQTGRNERAPGSDEFKTAQGYGPMMGGAGLGAGRPPLTTADREAFADARIAALRAGLKLNADQERLWPPVEDALRALARQRREARSQRRERFMAMREGLDTDIPSMLRFAADRQAASAEALRRLADASQPLYASLDEAQKRRLRVLGRFMGPAMGGMGHRGPHHGMGGPGGFGR